jgi:hypothetical protein
MKFFKTKFYFAGKTVLIKTNDRKVHQQASVYFPEFASTKKPDVTLEYCFYDQNKELSFDIMQKGWKAYEKMFLNKENIIIFKSKKRKNKKPAVSGYFDLKKGKGRIEFRMKKVFFWRFFVFNLAKCIAIYLNDYKGNLIHSSAVTKNKKGLLFPGKDNSGKTTIMMIYPEDNILGEDMNFLFKKGKKSFIQGFPFITVPSGITKKNTKPFEPKAVLFLKKSKKLELIKLAKNKAIEKLFETDIQGTTGFQNIKTKERIWFYSELFSKIPAFILKFPLKKEMWKKLEKELETAINLK